MRKNWTEDLLNQSCVENGVIWYFKKFEMVFKPLNMPSESTELEKTNRERRVHFAIFPYVVEIPCREDLLAEELGYLEGEFDQEEYGDTEGDFVDDEEEGMLSLKRKYMPNLYSVALLLQVATLRLVAYGNRDGKVAGSSPTAINLERLYLWFLWPI